jgi:glycosyltransferase involved in cell wall biosynthesis
MLATLEHIRDKDELVEECFRVLRPGGRVVVTVPSRLVDPIVMALARLGLADGMSLDEHHGFDPSQTRRLFMRHGFRFHRWQEFQFGLNHLFVFTKSVTSLRSAMPSSHCGSPCVANPVDEFRAERQQESLPVSNSRRNRPWLSVLMPTYNGAAYLASALESVRSQGDREIEVIAVDDGSTDSTLMILQAFSGRMPLKIIRHARVGNWAANTNEALAHAQGEYACLLHQDDLWQPHRLVTLRRLLGDRPGPVMLLHPSWYIDAGGRRVGLWRCPLSAWRHHPPEFVVERLLVQNFIAAPAPLFRREAALSVGGLDPKLWYAADWDLWLKLAAAGPALYCPRPLTAFRVHPSSQSVVSGDRVEEVGRELKLVLQRHLKAWEGRPPARPAVRRAASFSTVLNAELLAYYHGRRPRWLRLFWQFLALGPSGWHRYFRDSRIVERVRARLRADLGNCRNADLDTM